MPDLESRLIHVEAQQLAIGELDRLCLVVWRGAVTRERFERQRAALGQLARRHPDGMGFVCVVGATAPPPSDELRRASAAMVREHEAALRGVACVVEGTGFVASLARSALSAIVLILGRRSTPLVIQSHVSDAAAWIAPRVSMSGPGDVARAIERLRAELGAAPAAP